MDRECGARDLVALLAQGAGRTEGLAGSAERAGGRRVHRAALAPAGGRGAGGAARPLGGADVAPVLGGLLVLVVALPVYIRQPVPGLVLVLTLGQLLFTSGKLLSSAPALEAQESETPGRKRPIHQQRTWEGVLPGLGISSPEGLRGAPCGFAG
ncbi:unnamed protein product [Gulo gulo]|uniref:Uncharacterized protein n=1 Tax=Gulo gulo TaxID=48420 RepID=A0A9X9M9A6_GULGU|nr:unnamed protein product [Gulo gulo]